MDPLNVPWKASYLPFLKVLELSILLDVYFLLKHLSNKVLYDREIWVYSAINRQTMSETR